MRTADSAVPADPTDRLTTATGRSDAALVECAQAGEPWAFTQLYTRHYPAVVRMCAQRLGDVEGEDIAQEAFIRAWLHIDSLQGEFFFRAWVRRIASNLCDESY